MELPVVIGGESVIGAALADLWRRRSLPFRTTSRRGQSSAADPSFHLDLSGPAESWPDFSDCTVAVMAAGVTSLDECRRNPVETRFINVDQSIRLADKLLADGCFVVYLSTNLVFDGMTPFPRPDTAVCPRTEYGRQKVAAEEALLARGGCAVVRLTKVLSRHRPPIRPWLSEMRMGRPITALSDLVCAPLALGFVAEAVDRIARARESRIWHVSGASDAAYLTLAEELARHEGLDLSLVRSERTYESAIAFEHIPRHSALDAGDLRREFGLAAPTVPATLSAVLSE